MKRRKSIALLSAAALAFFSAAGSAQVYYRILFERGIHVMEGVTNQKIAIPIFQEIVNRHPDDRVYAARSQFFLGLCYKRMGSEEAYPALRKVITDFPDQTDAVRAAEAELASLSPPRPPAAPEPAELNESLIREAAADCGGGTVSNDGRYFASVDLETGDLKLYDITSGKTRRLTDFRSGGTLEEFVESPKFSPDGRRIAYGWRGNNQRCELRIVGVDGENQAPLFREEGLIGIQPAGWTADSGQILAVLTGRDLTSRIVFVSALDGTLRPVKDMNSRWPAHLTLSPDSKSLAYSLLPDESIPERDIYLYRIEEKAEIPLSVQPGDDIPLGWSAGGESLFCANIRSDQTDVWIIPAGEGPRRRPKRLIKSFGEPIDPAGFTESGTLFFRKKGGKPSTAGSGGGDAGLWAAENFLPGAGRTLIVPGDTQTIQDAVSAADPGDTVIVRRGVYSEHIVIGKPLTLQGESRDTVFIDGGGSGEVVVITAGDVLICGLTVRNGEYGIKIWPALPIQHITLSDMAITSNSADGIFSRNTGGHQTIENCSVSRNGGFGIWAHQFTGSLIRNCEIEQNNYGVLIGWSWQMTIEGNNIHHNTGGIGLDSCYDSAVTGNLIHSNSAGITLHYIASRNTIKNNIIAGNKCGTSLALNWSGFGGHKFYHNDFIANDTQVKEGANSIDFQHWDNGYPSGGNYWSDYAGQDKNSDGIGDTPHRLLREAADGNPLARPANTAEAVVEAESGPMTDSDPKNGWFPVSIELPAGLPVEDIDLSTLRLDGIFAPDKKQFGTGDTDGDGITELKAAFARRDVQQALESAGNGALTVSGNLRTGLPFQGTLSIKSSDK